MNIGDALSAFQSAAGLSAGKMNVFIRTLLLALTFIWAAWCVYGEIHLIQHSDLDIHKSSHKILRILFVVSIMIIVVFI